MIRQYNLNDLPDMIKVWNEVIEAGETFPWEESFDMKSGAAFFASQSYTVSPEMRGQHIGEQLVLDSLKMGKELGFRVLQFNAVVESNIHARHLYDRLGFRQLGAIPGGFRMKDGHYENIFPYYYEL